MSQAAEILKEQLRQMAEEYRARLPEKLRELDAAWDRIAARLAAGSAPDLEDALGEMRHLAHKLSGSGATFGMPEVSAGAREIERLLDQAIADGALGVEQREQMVRRLQELRAAVERGQPAQPAIPAASAAESAPVAPTQPRQKQPVVLLVDDDTDSAQVLGLQLRAAGYDVSILSELAGFAEMVQRLQPAAVVMDVSFPQSVLAGTDTVAELQQGRSTPLPVIFISARLDVETRMEAARAGGHAYFTKPVDVAALAKKLEALVRQPAPELEALRALFERESRGLPRRMLGDICVRRGWITERQLDEALASQPPDGSAAALAEALAARGLLTPAQKQEAVAAVFQGRVGLRQRKPPGEVCLEKGWITRPQLEQARQQQSRLSARGAASVLDVLVLEGALTARQRAEAEGESWGIPFVDLPTMESDYETVRALLRIIKPDVCRRLKAVPFQRTSRRVRVAMQNPHDVFAQDEIAALLGKNVTMELAVAAEEDILYVIQVGEQEGGLGLATWSMPAELQAEIDVVKDEAEEVVDADILRDRGSEAPVVTLSNSILHRAIQERASDIHLQPGQAGVAVRLRVDGVLRDVLQVPRELQPALTSRLKLMSELDIANRLVPQDGRIGITVGGKGYDLRVSALPTVWGEEIVIRILDKSGAQVSMDRLGLAPDTRERLERMLGATFGLILVTGPTGSGKTTTLYSALNRLNGRDRKICTVEDPVEYRLPGLTQVQANPVAGLSFAAALKAFLRQDPDVIMVGEIRDREVGSIALEAALTGHLVLSTLHTNDAPSAVTRLCEMGIEPFLVASTLVGVLAQRLVRRICERCKEAYDPDAEAVERIGFSLDGEVPVFFRGRGCSACHGTGYRGRMGIYELLAMSDSIRQMIYQQRPAHEVRALAREQGMTTLQEDAMLKIKMGLTTLEEALRVIAAG